LFQLQVKTTVTLDNQESFIYHTDKEERLVPSKQCE